MIRTILTIVALFSCVITPESEAIPHRRRRALRAPIAQGPRTEFPVPVLQDRARARSAHTSQLQARIVIVTNEFTGARTIALQLRLAEPVYDIETQTIQQVEISGILEGVLSQRPAVHVERPIVVSLRADTQWSEAITRARIEEPGIRASHTDPEDRSLETITEAEVLAIQWDLQLNLAFDVL